MADTPPTTTDIPSNDTDLSPVGRFLRATEIDTRLLGMIGALMLIWFGFHFYGVIVNGQGFFLTPRNLWNLSVQTSSIGIMATGMVLVIITRNIDLSVGALVGVTAMVMGILQVEILPQYLGLGHGSIWIVTVIVGMTLGATIGAFHGWLIAYRGIPAFIVTLGGLLIWRGCAFLAAGGKTISPVDETFALLGGGPYGAIGSTGSWIVGLLACAGVLWMLYSGRQNRRRHDFRLRPMWAETFLGALGCGVILGSVLLVNAYPWPKGIIRQWAARNDIEVPAEGLFISHGFAIPVLILIVVGILMTILMTRTRFGRYVFAIGGNPEAAALAGINTRWMVLKIFALMGMLAGLAGVVASARLNSATNALGLLDELYVIAAAVIGGTSLAGGVGTIYGAILGALVMQSLQSGMVLIGFDTAIQQIVVGMVLVFAVYLDNLYRSKSK
ncbi:sugar ABC transporter permease [Boseongicola aestuarii]|uniref:Xylose transport system permease protein XylH n=1 Tax=Boseongicola aestuarii TaxID=1470561 RepID=A0A238J5A6_9RHOB|nr:sugar ABC transporter permease [Boseongicola aestuarii]SMX25531.1 Xylose transport system permease protein XylH [Boseongicola aestuarii]